MTGAAKERGRPGGAGPAAGLYIHYPFCASKCPYCHFTSVPWSDQGAKAWREAIDREATAASALGLAFDTLYIGGGTPSLMPGRDVDAVRALAQECLTIEIAEFTLEANPGDDRLGSIHSWREAGVTRLSVGVQAFDDALLQTLGRRYTSAEALGFCRTGRKAGFESLSIDLMIGVPGETDETLEHTVEAVRDIGPDHVSVYFLENVEGLPFEQVLARHPVDEDVAVDHYRRMREALEGLGLAQYEISNFARPGKECRHNLKYWRYEPYLGLGPSACSHIGAERWCNKETLEDWAEALRRGHSARGEDVVPLTPALAAREALVFGLRLVRGVDAVDLRARTGIDVFALYAREIDELASEGLLVQAGARLWIPPDKLLISNAILSRFI